MKCALAFCVLLASAVAADAATITYTSSADFFAALGATATTTETYEGLPANSTIAAGDTVNGITYVSFPSGTSGRIDADFNAIGDQSLALTGSQQFFFPGQSINTSFAPTTAIGIFFNVSLSTPNSLFIQTPVGRAGNSAAYDIGSNLYFVGLISDTPFSSATIGSVNAAASGYNLDNLTLAPAATPVPEPASMLLLGSGLVALRMRARRSRPL